MDDPGPVHGGEGTDAAPADPRQQQLHEIASALRADLAMCAARIGRFD